LPRISGAQWLVSRYITRSTSVEDIRGGFSLTQADPAVAGALILYFEI
jgi:hypothetical protein